MIGFRCSISRNSHLKRTVTPMEWKTSLTYQRQIWFRTAGPDPDQILGLKLSYLNKLWCRQILDSTDGKDRQSTRKFKMRGFGPSLIPGRREATFKSESKNQEEFILLLVLMSFQWQTRSPFERTAIDSNMFSPLRIPRSRNSWCRIPADLIIVSYDKVNCMLISKAFDRSSKSVG